MDDEHAPAGRHRGARMVEMMRIDDAISSAEREVATRVLRQRFSLDDAETAALLDACGRADA